MEPGGEENWSTTIGLYDHKNAGTAVRSLIDQPIKDTFKSHENSPEKLKEKNGAIEGYRNPIWDSTTVSSKKNPSASPPNQRHVAEEIPVWAIGAKRRTKKGTDKAKKSYEQSEARPKKTKTSSAKRKKRNYESIAKTKATKGHFKSGRWTKLEHFKFLEALKMFGKEWQKVQQHVFTRTSTQARSHAQKFFVKLDKKQLTLDEFLKKLDIEQLKVDLKLGVEGDSTEYDEDQPLLRIANQKLNSVMNIALPDEKPKQKLVEPRGPSENTYTIEEHKLNPNIISSAEREGRNTLCGSKRSTKQRKAKMNHTFLHKKYTHTYEQEIVKRRKTDVEEEAIVECEDDTKIKIAPYMVEDYNAETLQKGNQDITGVHDYGNEMRKDSHIEDILEGSEDQFPDEGNKPFECFAPCPIDIHQDHQIEDMINEEDKIWNEFSMMQQDVQLESQMNLISEQNDLKLDSLHFSMQKPPKHQESYKLNLEDEDELNLDQNHDSLMGSLL